MYQKNHTQFLSLIIPQYLTQGFKIFHLTKKKGCIISLVLQQLADKKQPMKAKNPSYLEFFFHTLLLHIGLHHYVLLDGLTIPQGNILIYIFSKQLEKHPYLEKFHGNGQFQHSTCDLDLTRNDWTYPTLEIDG